MEPVELFLFDGSLTQIPVYEHAHASQAGKCLLHGPPLKETLRAFLEHSSLPRGPAQPQELLPLNSALPVTSKESLCIFFFFATFLLKENKITLSFMYIFARPADAHLRAHCSCDQHKGSDLLVWAQTLGVGRGMENWGAHSQLGSQGFRAGEGVSSRQQEAL